MYPRPSKHYPRLSTLKKRHTRGGGGGGGVTPLDGLYRGMVSQPVWSKIGYQLQPFKLFFQSFWQLIGYLVINRVSNVWSGYKIGHNLGLGKSQILVITRVRVLVYDCFEFCFGFCIFFQNYRLHYFLPTTIPTTHDHDTRLTTHDPRPTTVSQTPFSSLLHSDKKPSNQ